MQELGKRGISFNGTTFYDRTNYYQTFPANPDNLKWALEMEADRMINSTIARTDLDTEFSVVRNEMESGENNPHPAGQPGQKPPFPAHLPSKKQARLSTSGVGSTSWLSPCMLVRDRPAGMQRPAIASAHSGPYVSAARLRRESPRGYGPSPQATGFYRSPAASC